MNDLNSQTHTASGILAYRARAAATALMATMRQTTEPLALAAALDALDTIGTIAEALAETLRLDNPCAWCGNVRGVEYVRAGDLYLCQAHAGSTVSVALSHARR